VTRLERRLIRNAQRPASATLQRTFGDFPGFQSLTGREHEVLAQIALGASSKEAGRTLGISPRTVDVHRARIKEKLQVRRAVDLVRLVYAGAGKS
jgi:DNA-binding CsgD family transcriptional regulator